MTEKRYPKRGFASMDPQRQREIASQGGITAHRKGRAHEFTSEEARIAGRLGGLARKAKHDEPDYCPSCIGTGIGNPHVDRSVCWACNGSGLVKPARQFADEDRWAWNHFDPEPGDEELNQEG